jgi:ribosome biogenesis protein MAK21
MTAAFLLLMSFIDSVRKHLDTLFRITHSSNFNSSVQALMLLEQLSSSRRQESDRFYRTLYESLLDPRLLTSSKQAMYLNLLFKSLKSDLNIKRVKAFVKRLLQITTLHQPGFACGVIYLIKELEETFSGLHDLITQPESVYEDEEEHFQDVPDETETDNQPVIQLPPDSGKPQLGQRYDGRKRDPEYSNADRTCLWEIVSSPMMFCHFQF